MPGEPRARRALPALPLSAVHTQRRLNMRRLLLITGALVAFMTSSVTAQDIKGAVTGAMKSMGGGTSAGSGGEVAAGLKEALAKGVGNAVQTLSKSNGYFGDGAVK